MLREIFFWVYNVIHDQTYFSRALPIVWPKCFIPWAICANWTSLNLSCVFGKWTNACRDLCSPSRCVVLRKLVLSLFAKISISGPQLILVASNKLIVSTQISSRMYKRCICSSDNSIFNATVYINYCTKKDEASSSQFIIRVLYLYYSHKALVKRTITILWDGISTFQRAEAKPSSNPTDEGETFLKNPIKRETIVWSI